MQHERPRHGDVGRHHHAHQERRIEDVTVHRGDVWQPAEEIRIPLGKSASGFEHRGAEFPECVARDELIAVWPREEFACKRWISERDGRERVQDRRIHSAPPRACGIYIFGCHGSNRRGRLTYGVWCGRCAGLRRIGQICVAWYFACRNFTFIESVSHSISAYVSRSPCMQDPARAA